MYNQACIIVEADVAAFAGWHIRQSFELFLAGADRCSRGLGKIGKWLWCNMCSTSKEGCMIITRVAVGSVVLAAAAFNITGAIVKWPEWYSVPLDVEVMTLLRTIGKDHAKAVDKLDRF